MSPLVDLTRRSSVGPPSRRRALIVLAGQEAAWEMGNRLSVRLRITGTEGTSGPDAEPRAAARAGDRHAFDRLCEAHRQEIYSLCLRFLDRHEDAEDVVQEVFSRAWSRLPGSPGSSGIRPAWSVALAACASG